MASNRDDQIERDSQNSSKNSKEQLKDEATGLIQKFMEMGFDSSKQEKTPSPKILDNLTLEGVANYIKTKKVQNIIVMAGAGVSTSAGIPDFRSPKTGLYDNLAQYNLPHPQAIFEIDYFMKQPEPFFKLAKELFPGKFQPTPCHYFVRLLHEKNILLRLYSQNIDTLDHIAGIPEDKIVEAHGSFKYSTCLKCKAKYNLQWMKEKIMADEIPHCSIEKCEGIVKPNIVFFGENLPRKFFTCLKEDFPLCDLLIIMGTSLKVQPFAGLVSEVENCVPRLLINDHKVGQAGAMEKMLGFGGGLDFDDENNSRDVFHKSSCDDACKKLADLLGWKEDLDTLIKNESAKLDSETLSSL